MLVAERTTYHRGVVQRDDTVLVVDFGAQYAQLIARRVRELNVYCEIVPHRITAAEVAAEPPAAIILSGGPKSVHVEGAPSLDPAIYDLGIPILGICYGAQLIAQQLGGTVGRGHARRVRPGHSSTVTDARLARCSHDLPVEQDVWMSHFDAVTEAPRRLRRHGVARPTRRSPRWRTPSAGSGACSSIPRSCTRRTAWRCCAASCTISPAARRRGRWASIIDDAGRRGPRARSATAG